MTVSRRSRHGSRFLTAILLGVLVALLAASGSVAPARAPGGSASRTATTLAASEPTAGLQPSIHYQDAVAHAGDRIAFVPGERVELGFRPRAGDTWAIDGRVPRALPAGSASGLAMARSAQGVTWTGRSAPGAAPQTVETAAVPIRPAGRGLLRQVFGFLPYWELSDSSTALSYDVLSTIAYFSVGSDVGGNLLKRNPDGTLTTGWRGWTSQDLTDVIGAAHARGTRVVLTISMFAWTTGQRQRQAQLLGNPSARLNLARQAAAAVRDRGADGINLDFEPIASGYEQEFTALVRTMRAQLNAIAPGYQLTFDTTGFIGNYPIEAATAPGGADAIFIMGYDYRTAGSTPVGSIAPLGGPKYDIVDTIRAYTERVPASRLILGVPYYGRAWSTNSNRLNASNISGTRYGPSAAVVYANAMPLLAQHGRRWDPREKVAWTVYRKQTCSAAGCFTSWRQLYVDDVAALKAKYDTVIRYGLRGAGIWALGYDDGRPELNEALAQKFVHDTAGPVAGIAGLTVAQREEAFPVSWSGYDISGVANWDVQVSRDGGPWANWRLRTTLRSDTWLGQQGHGYAFRARARDRKGNVGAFTVINVYDPTPALTVGGFGRVEVDGLSMRAGPGTGATKLGELPIWARVQVVAGPVAADGLTWWRVIGPIREWKPIIPLGDPVWVAEAQSGDRYLAGVQAPNATGVDAPVRGLTFGTLGRASLGAAAVAHRTFSPNGDGVRDALRLQWTNGSALDAVALRVMRTDGTVVGSISLPNTSSGAQSFDWDGRVGGAVLPDGRYLVLIVGTIDGTDYGAPAKVTSGVVTATHSIVVDTNAPTVTGASATSGLLSPNGDGRLDTVLYRVVASGATGRSFTVRPVIDGVPGDPVRTATGAGPATVDWGGLADDRSVVPDGRYLVTLLATDAGGNAAGRSWNLVVDGTRPTVTVTATPATISPNDDGIADVTRLRWSSNEPVRGRVRVIRGTTTLRTWAFAARTGWSVGWGGRDAAGRRLPRGTYTIRVDALDAAGNLRAVTTTVVVR
ncbi:MAG TPA: glycosyl hydrolase family 18 protein [Candidatus Limnocylindrales bacterium]